MKERKKKENDEDTNKQSNAVIFPIVYFFYPETRYRSLEEMDDIFKKTTNVFNVVHHSIKEPHRFDKYGELKPEYAEEVRRQSIKEADADDVHEAVEKAS